MAENLNMTLKELKALIEEQTSPGEIVGRLAEEDYEEEGETVDERDRLTKVAEELEVASDKAGEVLKVFTSRVVGNPDRFLFPGTIRRIRKVLNALKEIENEVNRIIGSGKKASR